LVDLVAWLQAVRVEKEIRSFRGQAMEQRLKLARPLLTTYTSLVEVRRVDVKKGVWANAEVSLFSGEVATGCTGLFQ
jgi:hypothetical protein